MEDLAELLGLTIAVVVFGFYGAVSLIRPHDMHRRHIAEQARHPKLARLNPFRLASMTPLAVLMIRLGGVLAITGAAVSLYLLLLSLRDVFR